MSDKQTEGWVKVIRRTKSRASASCAPCPCSANASDFTRGFVCAIACLLNSHGGCTEAQDLMRCAGSMEKILRHADAEDITTLRLYGYLPNVDLSHRAMNADNPIDPI